MADSWGVDTTTGKPSGEGEVVGIPSFPGMTGTAAVMCLATLACAGSLAWLYRLQLSREKDWEEMSLHTFVLELERTLARSKLPDTRILNWAEIADLPENFWDEFNHMYAEFERCGPDVKDSLFFDFWNWAKFLKKPPPPPKLVGEEPGLFNLGLVIPYATLVKSGLGNVGEWRHDEDLEYDTLAPVGKTGRFLPRDTSQAPSSKVATNTVSKRTQKKGKGKGKVVVHNTRNSGDSSEVHTGDDLKDVKDPTNLMEVLANLKGKKNKDKSASKEDSRKDSEKLKSLPGVSNRKTVAEDANLCAPGVKGKKGGKAAKPKVMNKKEKEKSTSFGTAREDPSARDMDPGPVWPAAPAPTKPAAPAPAKAAAKPTAPAPVKAAAKPTAPAPAKVAAKPSAPVPAEPTEEDAAATQMDSSTK